VVFSFDALFGLTWHMLTTCLTLTSCHKPLWSFGSWFVIPLYASVNNVLLLCMIMAVIALLVGRSQSFASLHFVLRGNTARASNSQKPSFPMCRVDDLWGMPCAKLSAGWCPRSLHGSKARRPAPPKGPAVPAAGWRFHRGRPESGDEDKSPPMAVLLKVGWPR
jgi:hypothetical protein